MVTPTVGKDGSHHIILRDLPSGGSTEIGLLLALDQRTNRLRWRREGVASFADRRSSGPLSYSDIHPTIKMVHSQNDWSGGALQAVYDPKQPNKYASADGCDLRGANVLTLGMSLNGPMHFLIRNADFEDSDVSMWVGGLILAVPGGATLRPATITRDTTDERSGDACLKVAAVPGRTGSDYINAYFALANPTVYRSNDVTFAGWVKTDGLASTRARLFVQDDRTSHTSSSYVSSSTYTFVSVTHSMAGAANNIYVGIEVNDQTGSGDENVAFHAFADDLFVIPEGGVVTAGTASLGGSTYAGIGRIIAKWDESNDVWDAVYFHTTAAVTSLAEYHGSVYVAFGGGDNAYVYGSSASWTVSTIASDAKHAHFFVVSRQTLWKSRFDDDGTHYKAASSTSPANGGSWSAEYDIGSSDKEITGLFNFNDTLLIGKESGIHVYNRVVNDFSAADTFKNLTNEFEVDPNTENFERGKESKGWLYLAASGSHSSATTA